MDLIDTFPDFLGIFENYVKKTDIKDAYISYIGKFPSLFEIQKEEYKKEGYNWEEVAEKKVFPYLYDNISQMKVAAKNIHYIWKDAGLNFRQKLKVDFDFYGIIYVGLGLGAGWATKFENKPCVLFGLENIATLKWYSIDRLKALAAHELGHLANFYCSGKWEEPRIPLNMPYILFIQKGLQLWPNFYR
ncbi:MAG: hypothetical protein ACXQTP_01720 [Candidatus Methanofastidiosia archaeon]